MCFNVDRLQKGRSPHIGGGRVDRKRQATKKKKENGSSSTHCTKVKFCSSVGREHDGGAQKKERFESEGVWRIGRYAVATYLWDIPTSSDERFHCHRGVMWAAGTEK